MTLAILKEKKWVNFSVWFKLLTVISVSLNNKGKYINVIIKVFSLVNIFIILFVSVFLLIIFIVGLVKVLYYFKLFRLDKSIFDT